MSFAVLCPTRNRPDLCARMAQSTHATSDADVLIYVDRDDWAVPEVEKLAGPRTKVLVGDPIGRGRACNALIDAFPPYDIYLIVSDDIVFVRNGWDQEVHRAMAEFGDDIGLVHLAAENPDPHANWCCVSRKWVTTLGWMNYPGCAFYCQDTIMQALAEALGRIVKIEPKVLHHDCLLDTHSEQHFIYDSEQFLWFFAREFGGCLKKLKAKMEVDRAPQERQ